MKTTRQTNKSREGSTAMRTIIDSVRHDYSVSEPKPEITSPPSPNHPSKSPLNGTPRAEDRILYQLQKKIFGIANDKTPHSVHLFIIVKKKEQKPFILSSK
jgi:hypothetical protein